MKKAYDYDSGSQTCMCISMSRRAFKNSRFLSPPLRVQDCTCLGWAWQAKSPTSPQVMQCYWSRDPPVKNTYFRVPHASKAKESHFFFYSYFSPPNFYFQTGIFLFKFNLKFFSASGVCVNWAQLKDFAILFIFTHLCGSMSVRADISDSLFMPKGSASAQPVLMSHTLPLPHHMRGGTFQFEVLKIWLLPRLEKGNLFEVFSYKLMFTINLAMVIYQ